ncbi:MAG: SpoIIE family protein phosphatase [Nitrospirae bacterium]|nr:SpoIIE family protein phosphatase [Nitrospirota bacterium]MCL5238705.1 SpoIIE family protein phosphatase [Nitrospirota bacterium]
MPGESKITVPEDYLRNLEKKVEDLKALREVSVLISSTLDFNDLMTLVMEKAKKVMSAEACSILLYNKNTKKLEFEVALCQEEATSDVLKEKITLELGQGIAGWVAENLKPLVINDAGADSRFYRDADKMTGFKTKSLIAVPLVGRSGLVGVAEIINPESKDFFDAYDSEIFQTLCRQVAIAIENACFYKESLEKERLRQELEIASSLQKSFLPDSPVFTRGNLTVSAVNIPAAKVGGDLYDFIEPAEGKAGVLIGDVSGKGVSGAIYMAKIISDFRYIANKADSPEAALKLLNDQLSRAPRGMFLTAVYLIADIHSGELQVSVAGHPPLLLVTEDEVKVLDIPSGPPLGIVPAEYPSSVFQMKKGDRLLLLTDGTFEAKSKKGERIGFERFVLFINKHRGDGQLVQTIVEYVQGFSKGAEMADDLTMVELKWMSGS